MSNKLKRTSNGVPDGWSGAGRAGYPPIWVESRPCTFDDLKALMEYQGKTAATVWFDKYSIYGRTSKHYSTLYSEWKKQPWYVKWRGEHRWLRKETSNR